jgi:hypothetical protein
LPKLLTAEDLRAVEAQTSTRGRVIELQEADGVLIQRNAPITYRIDRIVVYSFDGALRRNKPRGPGGSDNRADRTAKTLEITARYRNDCWTALALISGSALLFFPLARESHDYWVAVHWICAAIVVIALLDLSISSLYARPWIHTSNALSGRIVSLFAICGSVVTGTLLIPEWGFNASRDSIVDIAHIFTSFVFTLLMSAT